jgi:glyoxylase-like metal-dependent hydrolase (beta-lactamase superfamily II)
VIVDPQRDAWRFLAVAEANKWRIRYVLETHVHNDYLSGALEVRRATGAAIGAAAKGEYAFPYVKLAEGDAIQVGALCCIALETPGHTWEYTSYAVYEDTAPDPAVVLTGGSLIVGSSGRTDLLGEAHTPSLTRAQYHTLKRLAALPEATRVLPTHGAGSFCTAAVPSMDRTTTIGQERRHNPALAVPNEHGGTYGDQCPAQPLPLTPGPSLPGYRRGARRAQHRWTSAFCGAAEYPGHRRGRYGVHGTA